MKITAVSIALFLRHIKDRELIITSINEFNKFINIKCLKCLYGEIIMDNKEFRNKVKEVVLDCYYNILNAFSKVNSNTLAPH